MNKKVIKQFAIKIFKKQEKKTRREISRYVSGNQNKHHFLNFFFTFLRFTYNKTFTVYKVFQI